MKAKTKQRENIIWNLAYLLVFIMATHSPKASVACNKALFFTQVARGLRTSLAPLDSTQQSSPLLYIVFSFQNWENSPRWNMLFPWQKVEVQEAKPIHDSTFKSSAQTWTYISSSHILLVKASHVANPDMGGRSLWEDTESCPAKNVDV